MVLVLVYLVISDVEKDAMLHAFHCSVDWGSSKTSNSKTKSPDQSDDAVRSSSADLLLQQLVPHAKADQYQHDPGVNLDGEQNSVDEVEEDWIAALNGRYGPFQCDTDTASANAAASSSRSSQEQRSSKRRKTDSQDDSQREAEGLHFIQSSSSSAQPAEPDDIEMPLRSTVDPKTLRVISEFADGRKRALGN